MMRYSASGEVTRRCKGAEPVWRQLTTDQPRVGEITHSDGDVHAFLNQIDELISQTEINRQSWIAVSETWQRGSDHMDADRKRRSHLQDADRLRARRRRRLFYRFCFLQQS
ncbi:hypothetical protein FBZ89_12526 [Nitrospirillum amazonense]|uniref:Uncharacterized protein n=1 Tax=Nitrospirillum amazonense TaxID=28077 RepID=A0A560ESI8_9PROT|nr:hypothetical protein FBZ89_12526 [Nitrospirillum amazonense]